MTESAVPLAPMSYSGLFDDAGLQYAAPVAELESAGFFRRAIAKNVFFSGGVLINDGNLINHPAARAELLRDDSLLRIMMRTQNFVRVLSRNGEDDDMAEVPVAMAASGNASFQRLLVSSEWPALRTKLTMLSKPLSRGNRLPWPVRSMHVGFTQLMDRALAGTTVGLGLVRARAIDLPALRAAFHYAEPKAGNARFHFEQAAAAAVRAAIDASRIAHADFNAAMDELMRIANQAYHYNFGMCLNEDTGETIGVDTTIGAAFDELLALDEVYEGSLDDVRVFRLPRSLPFHNGRQFDDIIDASTVIGQAKMYYLASLDAVFRAAAASDGPTLTDAKTDFAAASEGYRYRIAEHFGSMPRDDREELLTNSAINFGIGKVVGSAMAVVSSAPLLALAIDLLSGVVTDRYKPGEMMLRRMRIRELDTDMREDIPPLVRGKHHEFTARELMVRPNYSSLAFNPAKVAEHVAGVPRFR